MNFFNTESKADFNILSSDHYEGDLNLDDSTLLAQLVFTSGDFGQDDRFRLLRVEYHLTTTGYDVALKIRTHLDQLQQSKESLQISVSAAETADHSRRIAGRALWAAGSIALFSALNFGLSLYLAMCNT